MASNKQSSNPLLPIIIIGILFFVFGFITWLNATLIPFLKISCQLSSDLQAYLVVSAFYISYFVMALPASFILKWVGFKNGMVLGLFVMACGSLLFIPAAYTRTYGLFLTGLFIQGTGLTLLQTAVNPYVTIVGPIESAAKRISIMGICNKMAGVLSPLIMGIILFKDVNQFEEQLKIVSGFERELLLNSIAQRVILPYIIMAISLACLALMIYFTHLPDVDTTENDAQSASETKFNIFQYPQLILGVLAIFTYVGAEVIAADTIIQYGELHGFDKATTKVFSSYTLFAMVVGYILGIATIPKYIKQEKALAISALIGIILTTLSLLTKGYYSILSLALLGLANAIMWPAIWPLAINGLGKFTKTGSALLIMGILGGALLPLVYGYLADPLILNKQMAYILLIPLYLYIFFYAFKGHTYRKW